MITGENVVSHLGPHQTKSNQLPGNYLAVEWCKTLCSRITLYFSGPYSTNYFQNIIEDPILGLFPEKLCPQNILLGI
jgi:hypothetical protein